MAANPIRNKTYGPFEVISELSGDGRTLVSLPFTTVQGCKLLVAVRDNFAAKAAESEANHLYPGAEITIWGQVMGLNNMLRRQQVHMKSGPMSISFDTDDGWDQVFVKARNICGGSFQNAAGSPPFPTQDNGFSIKVQLFLKPRDGFASLEKGKC